jgi:FKBP-type peptidyl-prolyl cis-trans isomerase 2
MEKGDIILVEFTGRDPATGRIFDTTSEKIAKQAGIYSEQGGYGTVSVIVGEGHLLPGLDEKLLELKEGQEETVELPPEKAFGERQPKLIAVLPLREFKKRELNPFPGLIVDVNGRPARVQTVSGGRVRVDFNNDLAGKKIEYKLKIVKKLIEPKEQVNALVQRYLPLKEKPVAIFKEKEVTIEVPEGLPPQIKELEKELEKAIKKHAKGIEKVAFKEKKLKKESKKKKEIQEKGKKKPEKDKN